MERTVSSAVRTESLSSIEIQSKGNAADKAVQLLQCRAIGGDLVGIDGLRHRVHEGFDLCGSMAGWNFHQAGADKSLNRVGEAWIGERPVHAGLRRGGCHL